jgi:hypothetical protein
MYGGMAQISFHLGNKKGGIVTLLSTTSIVHWNGMKPIPFRYSRRWLCHIPFTIFNVWQNGMSPIPLKLHLSGFV